MPNNNPLETLWRNVVHEVSRSVDVSPRILAVVESAVPQGILGETLYLEVDSDFARDMIEQRARDEILAGLNTFANEEQMVTNFSIVVNPSLRDTDEEVSFDNSPSYTPIGASVVPGNSGEIRLNPKYTFESFVIGPSNRFAHAAALAVAESPAKAYNPLFIYGGSGLGKTHLLHAISHYAEGLFPNIKVRYVSSEEFTNDYINALALSQMQSFNRRYREVDLLLIDDIQFLGGKDATQDTFFHTFNTLHEHGKQVVITSDVPPKQLSGFEQRMRSRFGWGLITDIQVPDLETRIAILRKKVTAENLGIGDDVLEYIASKVATNIRELEGTLIRVTAFASLNRVPIDLPLVQTILKDLITLEEGDVSPTDIIEHVARYFELSLDEL
ncbi:MAG: chromosomal replication initiator protein DnaA, partial [Actinomycetota bacterium]